MFLNNNIKTKIFYISIVGLFLLLFGLVKWYRHLIVNKHEVANCIIDEVKTVGREQVIGVKYHFIVEGKVYYGDASFGRQYMNIDNFKLLEHKCVPVAYDIKYYKMVSYILIFPDDYKEFNVPFPDSLRWILPLIKKS